MSPRSGLPHKKEEVYEKAFGRYKFSLIDFEMRKTSQRIFVTCLWHTHMIFFCSLCFVEGIKQLCLPQASLSLSHSVTCFLWAFSFFVFFAIQKGSLKNASILLNVPYNIFCITTAMCVCRCEWMCLLRDILKNRFMQAMLDLFFYCVILNVHDTQKFTVIFFLSLETHFILIKWKSTT